MATYFLNCSTNKENFDLCLQYNVAGFTQKSGYNTGDRVFLIVKSHKDWLLGARGELGKPTNERPWSDQENYPSAFQVEWDAIPPVSIEQGLKRIYSNFGLAIQGKKDLEIFGGKGNEILAYLDSHFSAESNIYRPNLHSTKNQTTKTIAPAPTNTHVDFKAMIEHVEQSALANGFSFSFKDIANFYLSLRTKPFVILAGVSGTGKSQLPRQFAKALGFEEEQLIQVAVRPDWTDSSDLLGYVGLDGMFHAKDLTRAIQAAAFNPTRPFFFILDEMNLARVEHYLSDFLSVIETREWKDGKINTDPVLRKSQLEGASNANEYANLHWPYNLYLIGTVNMDETTHPFSRKVLDRANSIEMNEIDLRWKETKNANHRVFPVIGNDVFVTPFLTGNDLSSEQRSKFEPKLNSLTRINEGLQKAEIQIAYRVRDEIAFYMALNESMGLLEETEAWDFQITQKILPRINGSSDRIREVILHLLGELEGKDFMVYVDTGEKKPKDRDLKFPKSSQKLLIMLRRFDNDRFTSFWM